MLWSLEQLFLERQRTFYCFLEANAGVGMLIAGLSLPNVRFLSFLCFLRTGQWNLSGLSQLSPAPLRLYQKTQKPVLDNSDLFPRQSQ